MNNLDLNALQKLSQSKKSEELFKILDDNEDFLIVEKQNGIAIQATDTDIEDLETLLNKKYTSNVYVLSRIDQPVSGIVIFGKTKSFADGYTELLKNRLVDKTYLAIVSGQPSDEKQILTHYIKKNYNRAFTSDEPLDNNYKEAVLEYKKVQSFDNYHLLKVKLLTGRFHQIRAQLATVGLPIKGDIKYGSRRPNLNKSIGLLAYKLEFKHPLNGMKYQYTSSMPSNDVIWSLVNTEAL